MRKWRGRRISAAVAASWILATVLTSLVVWRAAAVFNAASSTKVLTPPQVSARLDAATASSSSRTASPSAQTHSRSATPASSRTSAAPSATAKPADPSVTTSTEASAAPATPSAVVKTWTVAGGTLSVSCQGQAISLVFASPRDGWRVETERAVDVVEVSFERVGQGVEVRAVCTGGIPSQTSQATQGDR